MMLLFALLLLLAGCTSGHREAEVASSNDQIGKVAIFYGEKSVQRHEDTIVLGSMNEGETAMTRFKVINHSGKTLQIERIHSGCGCTTAEWNKDPIDDGDEMPVTLFFNSNGQFGKQFKTIDICSYEGEVCRIFLATEVKY